jgi:phage-related protein
MPKTCVVFYKDDTGEVPVLEWLRNLKKENAAGFERCSAAIKELGRSGHELRRPFADALRDGIRELRAKHQHVQYRILYFFNGRDFAVLSHAIVKKGSEVPDKDIDRAIKRMMKFISDPVKYAWQEDHENAYDKLCLRDHRSFDRRRCSNEAAN